MAANGTDRQRTTGPGCRWRQPASAMNCAASSRGFTLLEVLIALALIGVLLVPAMSSTATLLANKARGESRAEALELARSAMEAIKGLNAGAFVAGRTLTTVRGPGGRASYDVERTLAIRDQDPKDPGNRLWELTVTVYAHPKRDGVSGLCSLTTYVSAE